jgi:tetratricopeptide (TPR) repeat protein
MAMDWSVLESLLRCQAGSELHFILLLSALANLAAVIWMLYGLWRWWRRSAGRARVADALRDEGKHRVQIRHRGQAMALYNLSIRMNPRAAHVYYLRGCLKEELEQIDRAIADWKRCLDRHRKHAAAVQKLAQYGVADLGSGLPSWAIAVGAGAGAVVILVLAGAFGS